MGRCVAEAAVLHGFEVTTLGRRQVPGIMIVHDLRTPMGHIPATEWVFHLAGGYAGAGLRELESDDLAIARHVLDWGVARGVKNWVFASAAEVYGAISDIASEDAPTCPVIPYGSVKLKIEHLFASFAARVSSCRVVVLRIGEVYGANGRLIQELRARFIRGFCPWFGPGAIPLSFVHVDDVAHAFIDAARAAQSGLSVYNVADDEPTTWREFLRFMSNLLGAKDPLFLPLPLARWYAAGSMLFAKATGRSPIVTQHVVRLLTTPKAISNLRAKKDLGLKLRYPNYRAGLEQVLGCLADRILKEGFSGLPHHSQNG